MEGSVRMTKTYTLIDPSSGQVYARGLRADHAMHEILVQDNNRWSMFKEFGENGEFLCFRLYYTNRPFMAMCPTIYFSVEPNSDAAIQEIAEKVLADSMRADFPLHAWEDQEWDSIVAED